MKSLFMLRFLYRCSGQYINKRDCDSSCRPLTDALNMVLWVSACGHTSRGGRVWLGWRGDCGWCPSSGKHNCVKTVVGWVTEWPHSTLIHSKAPLTKMEGSYRNVEWSLWVAKINSQVIWCVEFRLSGGLVAFRWKWVGGTALVQQRWMAWWLLSSFLRQHLHRETWVFVLNCTNILTFLFILALLHNCQHINDWHKSLLVPGMLCCNSKDIKVEPFPTILLFQQTASNIYILYGL